VIPSGCYSQCLIDPRPIIVSGGCYMLLPELKLIALLGMWLQILLGSYDLGLPLRDAIFNDPRNVPCFRR